MSVFTLSWGTSALGYTRTQFLMMQLFGILFFAATIPFAGKVAEHGRRKAMIWMTALAIVFGLVMPTLFESGTIGAMTMLALGFGLTGLVYGPLGTVLSEMFPTSVRYTRQLDRVQRGRDLRRHAVVVRGNVAGAELRPELRRVLPLRRGDGARCSDCSRARKPKTKTCALN